MQIWAGLGNPGAQYALHRHNVGFMAVDAIAEVHGFGPWQKKFRSLVSEGRIGRHRILLLKPQTYMNDSGDAVQQALHFYKLDVEALTAFHDELDLAPMKVKVKRRRRNRRAQRPALDRRRRSAPISAASASASAIPAGPQGQGHPHVLGNYAKSEMEPLSDLLGAIAAEAEWLADGDDVRFMSEVARRLRDEGRFPEAAAALKAIVTRSLRWLG